MGMDVEFGTGAWSPQRNEILFPDRAAQVVYRTLWIVHSDGSGLHQLAIAGCGGPFSDPNGRNCLDPTWSPDGQKTAFSLFDAATGERNIGQRGPPRCSSKATNLRTVARIRWLDSSLRRVRGATDLNCGSPLDRAASVLVRQPKAPPSKYDQFPVLGSKTIDAVVDLRPREITREASSQTLRERELRDSSPRPPASAFSASWPVHTTQRPPAPYV